MKKSSSLLPAIAAALLLSAAPFAMAAGNSAPPANGTAMQAGEASHEHESKAEIQAFQQVKVPLTQAVQAAEKHSNGKAIDASFEQKNGMPIYRIKTYQNNSVCEGTIDANSGQVAGSGQTTPQSKLDQEDMQELQAAKNAQTSLVQAVQAAEQKQGGKAIDAGLEARNGKVAYELELVKNGQLRTVTVDPQNGQLASNQQDASGRSGSANSHWK
jgi:uncharacterized membrane protein YkoI